ncbi:MAG: CcmD family protein [Bacteroidota bacterium]|nr:CcmD family protein [Bacteroidota bacterium]MDP4211429.1 CcmD family protein [Bacteroidota bacterium]MDP4248656.1 CcmD family protein [Bacteroidota bacterium]
MYKQFLRLFFSVTGMLTACFVQAQDSLRNEKPQMADAMRSNGKIYVVVAVLLVILAGLFLYLFQTDRKLTRLEQKIK